MWFRAARYMIFNNSFVIGSRFGSRDWPPLGGNPYKVGSGGGFMELSLASLFPCFTSMEVEFTSMEVQTLTWKLNLLLWK